MSINSANPPTLNTKVTISLSIQPNIKENKESQDSHKPHKNENLIHIQTGKETISGHVNPPNSQNK